MTFIEMSANRNLRKKHWLVTLNRKVLQILETEIAKELVPEPSNNLFQLRETVKLKKK